MFTLHVKRRFPEAEILAFEPVAELAESVRRNVALHRLDRVTVHEVALGRTSGGSATFTYFPLVPSSSTRYPGGLDRLKERMRDVFSERLLDRMYRGRDVTVAVERLSAFLGDAPVDLLKVDVVGAELDLLHGIDEAHWPLLRQVILDVQDVDGRLTGVRELLASRGFEVWAAQAPLAGDDRLNYVVHGARLGD